ncbi:MAG: baseplate J/gp47 family protein [Gammaproteobacteria bacterium]|nr:baseplate J/gp47 family protein [Gammaproteobacteria bacterium]MDH5653082.1 baseplate J/gp47 family protein [Gammaproteobacteria bacterium]
MPLPEPKFDSRTYRDILNEALARIPAHNPEWTNFNDSDPGITLLQLFAFMSENIIYRTNLIPQRNRQKFLRLLGIPVSAARAARGLIAFRNPSGELKAVNLATDQLLYAGEVPFRTEQALQVLPVEAKLFYKGLLSTERQAEVRTLYQQLYASFEKPGEKLDFYETRLFAPPAGGSLLPSIDIGVDTIDSSLWIALIARSTDTVENARKAIGGKVLTLGVMPALGDSGAAIYPRGPLAGDAQPTLVYEIPNTNSGTAAYSRLTPRSNADLLSQPGVVELILPESSALTYWNDLDPLEAGTGDFPPSLQDTDDQERLITWVRIRSPEISASRRSGSRQLTMPLSWVGINAATVVQRAHVASELLAIGTGEPDQSGRLINTPVIGESVRLRINGELWQQIDDLMAAAPEVLMQSPRFSSSSVRQSNSVAIDSVYTLDRESGEIRFGDGLHGRRPPKGASIQVSYDYGGGRRGSVGIGVITKGANLPPGILAGNPVPTWGGEEGETINQAEKRIPAVIRNRERLVSKQDIEEIALATPGIDLGRLEVLPLVHPEQPFQDSFGVVTLLVIPKNDPVQPDAPRPDKLFLQTMCEYLEPRRILTTELHIIGPTYIPIWVSISVDVITGYNAGPVLDAVRQEVRRFLSPLQGGYESKGWPLNKVVEAAEIAAAATRVSGIAKINHIYLGNDGGQVDSSVTIEGLQLPRLMAVEVVTGTAPGIDEIRGAKPAPTSGTGDDEVVTVPVPVIPNEC